MIYTFYSYKGGVGRSMALANVAECFCRQGVDVLMVDWDLEAPGLESFFFDPEPEEDSGESTVAPSEKPGSDKPTPSGIRMVQSKLGLIDMLTEYRRSYSSILPPQENLAALPVPKAFRDLYLSEYGAVGDAGGDFAAALNHHLPSISTYVVPLRERRVEDGVECGALSLLPAGWRYKERFTAYSQAVQSFDWDGLYAAYRGKDFFNWLRDRLLEQAQVVLIDSRTGVTEMGGVCTRQMADVVVSLSAPNNQNIDGVARMVRTFRRPETLEARGKRKLDTIIVPTRVDPNENALLSQFKLRFERLADERNTAPEDLKKLGKKFWDLQIPYRTIFSYQERRVIGPGSIADPTKALENAYWKIATHLALLAPETHVLRQKFAEQLQREFPALLPKVVLSYTPDGATDASRVREYLQAAGIKIWPDLTHQVASDDLEGAATRVISQAAHLVVVLSAGASNNDAIRRELRFARQQGKSALVLALGGQIPAIAWLQSAEIYSSLTPQFVERLLTTSRVLRAPVLAPKAPTDYVERLEIQQQIKTYLLQAANAKGRTDIAVCGVGGSGKSATMARLCQDEDIIDAYPAGIFYVSPEELVSSSRIINAIDPEHTSGPDTTVAALVFGRRYLLIVDDVWSEKDISAVRGFTSEPFTAVVLTRDMSLATAFGDRVVEIGELTSDEAAAFLPGDTEIGSRLQRLALTLSLARAALQQEIRLGRSNADALASISQRLDRHGLVAFDRPEGRTESLARSIEYTLSHLQDWERNRFEQLADLPAGEASLVSAAQLWRRSPPGIGEPEPLTQRHMEALCQKLSNLGLVHWDPRTQTLAVHDLIRGYFASQGMLRELQAGGTRHISSGRDRKTNKDVMQARRILGGVSVPFEDLIALFKRLKGTGYFSYARQLLGRIRRLPEAASRRLYWAQQHALCTYKDQDLPYLERADRAFEILEDAEDLDETKDQETLGLTGAIFKYKWATDNQRINLEQSLAYYLRGYQQGCEKDQGYTGINAAFILDVIAFQEESGAKKKGTVPNVSAQQQRERAKTIRTDIAEHLPALVRQPDQAWLQTQWWFLVTVAEAYFGLQRYEEANYWLREALAISVEDWEFRTTARQLVHLALLQNGGKVPAKDSPAFKTLRIFLGHDANALRSLAIGKVGLALSGGGFRASLFHIGVLAKLAEMDVLRHVEVLSCVSGGSIIGAHYYLEVKRLLEEKRDEEITRADFIDLVKRIEVDFMAGIQTNLRTKLAANPLVNLLTFIRPHYTLTDRLGGLFEKKLYSKAGGKGPLFLNDLLVHPKGAPEDFSPKLDNWHRAAKVPDLILNATSLNTGHNWQFTATWMGEPPSGVLKEVDGNDLLRRMYYWEAPKDHQNIRLGRAVAASACVPGLFDPVEFAKLYPNRTLRLVDGGVHDNQGVRSLLEQECSTLLVSDASGQMSSQNYPGADPFHVPLRASGIQGARVREAQYLDLDGRRRSAQIKSLMFIHLKKDLEPDPVDWIDCIDPLDATEDARPAERRGPLTRYGVLKTVQERLAAIRTDLDSFADVEAYALMLSGYRMTEHEFAACVQDFPVSGVPEDGWRFLSVEKAMDRVRDFEKAHDHLMHILRVGESRALKFWRLSHAMKAFGGLFLAGLITLVLELWAVLIPFSALASKSRWVWGACVALPIAAWLIFRVFRIKKPFSRIVTGFFLSIAGWVLALTHLMIFDPMFLTWGRVKSKQFAGVKAIFSWVRPLTALAVVGLAVLLNPLTMAHVDEWRGDYNAARKHWSTVLRIARAPEKYRGRLAYANWKLGDYNDAAADCRALNVSAMDAPIRDACADATMKSTPFDQRQSDKKPY